MSLFHRSRPAPVVERRDQMTETLEAQRAARMSSWAGVAVTPESALTVPAVWASILLTAGTISQFPLDEYTVGADGERVAQKPSPLIATPSADVVAEDWRFQAIESAQLHGGAYGVIAARDPQGLWPTQVELVHPNRVQTRTSRETGQIEWKIDGRVIPAEDVWHMAGRPKLGTPFGLSLIEYMAPLVGVGIAARQYGAAWFSDGGAPVIVARPQSDPGPDGAVALKEKIRNALRTRQPAIIPTTIGLEEWKGSTPEDAALVDLLRQNATDVAQFFLVPPELVGGRSGDSMTYANVEGRILDLLAFAVGYWMVKLEKALTRSLPRGRYVKLNESAFIRTDVKTKTETLVASTGGPFRTVNEARALLDLPPVADGDDVRDTDASTPDAQDPEDSQDPTDTQGTDKPAAQPATE